MEVIGKYRLHQKIAQGGMAEIFSASSIEPSFLAEGLICIKRIRPEFSHDAEFVRMFEQEARIAMALKHPNVVKVFDFDTHDGRLFLAMEYIDGWDLKRILKTTAALGAVVPIGFAFHVFSGLMGALQAAGSLVVGDKLQEVVHRDISPHNILVSREGDVKLTDFGIAKARGTSRVTRTGVIKGKLAYLSPEQASGENVGPASDMYCAGLVLCEMLTGKRFLQGESDSELLAAVMNPPRPQIPWLSDEINRYVERLLSKNSAERFSSPQEALDALRKLPGPTYGQTDAAMYCTGLITSAIEQNTGVIHTTPSPVPADDIQVLEELPTRTSKEIPRHLAPIDALFRHWRIAASAVVVFLAVATVIWFIRRPVTVQESVTVTAEQVAPTRGGDAAVAAEPSIEPSMEPSLDAPQLASSPLLTLSEPVVEGRAQSEPQAPVEKVERITVTDSVSSTGTLQVLCRPWAHVSIDGKPVGTTPVRNKVLPVGTHRVRLRNVELNYDKSIVVTVSKGKTERISEQIETNDTDGV